MDMKIELIPQPVADVRDLGGVAFASFRDPDGNTWELQEIRR
ncbi:MAG: hypothetical protein PIR02_14075 [Microbacterium enclense]